MAIALFRQQGICLATYSDNWLLLAQTKQQAATNILVSHLVDLGILGAIC